MNKSITVMLVLLGLSTSYYSKLVKDIASVQETTFLKQELSVRSLFSQRNVKI